MDSKILPKKIFDSLLNREVFAVSQSETEVSKNVTALSFGGYKSRLDLLMT